MIDHPRTLTVLTVLAALPMISCDDGSPSAAQSQEARETLPSLLTGVSRSRRSEDSVVALRWDIENVSLGDDLWSWEEVQVLAESGADAASAETLRYRISLDPSALGPNVPTTLTMQSWGLQLQCAEILCITRTGMRINVENGQRTETPLPEESIARTEWLFDEYEDRDSAVRLVKTALGYRQR